MKRTLQFFPAVLSAALLFSSNIAPAASPDNFASSKSLIVGAYFEEWSIYFAGYNIANLQSNGVADKLTHLFYAFGDATPAGCAIADAFADYQALPPSVSGAPYTGPLLGSTVHVTRTATTATVSITGTAESIVPFLHLPVHAEATGDTEQFTVG